MATDEPSRVVVIAGPNGAGKSTLARRLLPPGMAFVNADEIARDLPAEVSGNRDMEAGRLLLRRLDELSEAKQSFAVETTLASRSLAPRIARLRAERGYTFDLFFIWSPSPDFSILRVASRVRAGGHHVPEEVIRRRYIAGLRNFFDLYRPLADRWRVYRNVRVGERALVASGSATGKINVYERALWSAIVEGQTR